MCDTMKANGDYVNGVGYALAKLGAIRTSTTTSTPATTAGSAGTTTSARPRRSSPKAARAAGSTVNNVHGFITNTANYSALWSRTSRSPTA